MRLHEFLIPEALRFCISQYERFNISLPEKIIPVVEEGIAATFMYVDYIDPYSLFWGLGDVDITDDWASYAYEVKDGKHYVELDPETVETFFYVPGQAEDQFHYMMSHPGVRAIPSGASSGILEVLNGDWHGDTGCEERIDSEVRKALYDLCRNPDGSVNNTTVDAYFELAAWASFAWISGPLSRDARVALSDIYATAIRYGECIMVDGSVIAPGDYRRLSRPPKSCHRCGISAWCTELIICQGSSRHLCEHCLSEGMPRSKRATCGTKMCMLVRCPHHPHHGLGSAGLGRTYREYGQLSSKSRGQSGGLLSENSPNLLRG